MKNPLLNQILPNSTCIIAGVQQNKWIRNIYISKKKTEVTEGKKNKIKNKDTISVVEQKRKRSADDRKWNAKKKEK